MSFICFCLTLWKIPFTIVKCVIFSPNHLFNICDKRKRKSRLIVLCMRKNILSYKAFIQGTRRMKSSEMANTPAKNVSKTIIEGRAILRVTSDKVFYNPVQEFNRDLSIAVLSVFVQDYKKQKLLEADKTGDATESVTSMEDYKKVDIPILEALSATGLRSIRYAKEIVDITKIIANDISPNAVATITENVAFNNVDHIVEVNHDDACLLMQKHKARIKRFAAVDLDPYGTPAIFLDGAVQSVADGGLLLVTATDMAVLCGNSPDTCYNKYGAISLRTKCCHEMALRILLQSIESHANRYSRYIVPMLSVSADFYIRVFVKVYSGARFCKSTTSKLAMVYHCVGCSATTLQPLGEYRPNPTPKKPDQMKSHLPNAPPVGEFCENCNQKHQMGGPIWAAPIHDEAFVSRVLTLVQDSPTLFHTARRLAGMLAVVREELADAPLYYTLDRLCGTVHSEMIPIMVIRSALLNAGYKVSYSHANKLSIKTSAPTKLVWDIMRTWLINHPVKESKIDAQPMIKHILSRPITYKVDLTIRDDANPNSRRERRTRFQFNPTPHWGPGCRSTINSAEIGNLKSKRNQNKRKDKWRQLQKRQHSPTEVAEAYKKRPSTQTLLIDTTTSEPSSEAGTEYTECDTSVADLSPAETVVESGVSKPDTGASTSEKPSDANQ